MKKKEIDAIEKAITAAVKGGIYAAIEEMAKHSSLSSLVANAEAISSSAASRAQRAAHAALQTIDFEADG